MNLQWAKVHIFISSTFNDMHAERDYLVKRVLPELHDWCEQRRLRLVDVDLRWGVTEADATSEQTVATCLERIDQCRPFFLCLLGQRYGWIPEAEAVQASFQDYPRLKSAVAAGSSVTELEIMHAVINPFHRDEERLLGFSSHRLTGGSFFYLREDDYLSALPQEPPQLRCIYTDQGESDYDQRQQKLQQLRQRTIPSTGLPLRHYQASWDSRARTPEIALPLACPALMEVNVRGWQREWQRALELPEPIQGLELPAKLKAAAEAYNMRLTAGRLGDFRINGRPLHEIILADLKEAIGQRFPDHMSLEVDPENDLQQELDQHEEFLFANSEGFIERRGDFAELDDYVIGDSRQLFVLTAEGGMGKSMLLANWIDQRRRHPDQFGPVTFHSRFIGQSDGSTTVAGLLRYLLRELQEVAGKIPKTTLKESPDLEEGEEPRQIPLEIPADPQKLYGFWRQQLPKLGKDGKTVIVIDALNQLRSGLQDLSWLPTAGLSENLKMIVSFRRGEPAAEALLEELACSRHVRLSEVPPFDDPTDRRQLVDAYLSQYLKDLDEPRIKQLIKVSGAKNPLYLKVVLSELRVFGAFQQLEEKIENDFGETPISAFKAVLTRLENDPAFTQIEPTNGVPYLFGLLLHARHGLSAVELTDLLMENLSLKLKQQDAMESVHHFLRQVKPYMGRRQGRFDFFYESFERAVRGKYVHEELKHDSTTKPAAQWHGLLADYFEKQPLNLPPDQGSNRRKLAELPFQQIHSRRWDDLRSTLTDFNFLQAKVSEAGPRALIEDYEEASAVGYEDKDLPLVLGAIRLSSQILTSSADQLAGHLVGRLMAENEPAIQDLLEKIAVQKQDPWLRPLFPTLIHPGGPLIHSLRGHEDGVTEVLVTSDGVRGISGSADQTVRVWNLETGEVLHILEAHDNRISALALSPDNDQLFSGSWDHSVKVWSLRSGKLLKTLSSQSGPIHTLNVTPDGSRLIAGSAAGTLEVWDLDRMSRLYNLEGHTKFIRALAVTPDSSQAVSASEDATLRVWDLDRGVELHTLQGHSWEVRDVAISSDGTSAVSAAGDDTLKVWDLRAGKEICTLVGHSREVCAVVITPDDEHAISGSNDGHVKFWDLSTGEVQPIAGGLKEHKGPVSSLAISQNGTRLISGSYDSDLMVWELDPADASIVDICTLEGHIGPIIDVALTPDGHRAITGSDDSAVYVWNLTSGEQTERPPSHRARVSSVAVTDDGAVAVSSSFDKNLMVWDLKALEHLHTLEGHESWIITLVLSTDGKRAVTGSFDSSLSSHADYSLRVWDLERGEQIHVLKGHELPIYDVALSADGIRAVSASGDNSLKVWDIEQGKELFTLSGHSKVVNAVAMSHDGSRAVSASMDKTLRVWDLEAGTKFRTLMGHRDWVTAVAVTPDGSRAISGAQDGGIRVWDLETGKMVHRLVGHSQRVSTLSVTPEGKGLISGSRDTTLMVWDLDSGEKIHTLAGHQDFVNSAAISIGNRAVLSGSRDNSLRVWNLDSGQEIAQLILETSVIDCAASPDGVTFVAGDEGGVVHFLRLVNADVTSR